MPLLILSVDLLVWLDILLTDTIFALVLMALYK